MKGTATSYRPEVIADSSGKWSSNMLRFATSAEADAYLRDLEFRWTSVREIRVCACDDPVNAVWRDGKVESKPG